MKKILFFFIIVLCLGLMPLQGYGGTPRTRAVVDQRGQKVLIPAKVERIVTFSIPLPLVIWAIDGNGNRIAGMHPKAKAALKRDMLGILAPELKSSDSEFVKGKTMFNVNIEEMIKLAPDVVFQWARMRDDIRMMEAAGIPVIALNARTYDDVKGWIRILGQVLQKPEKARALIDYHEQTEKFIVKRTANIPREQRPKGLFINSLKDGNISVVGKHNFYSFVTGLTGVENCAKGLLGRGGKRVNMEQILIWNPDIIFIGNLTGLTPEDLFRDKGWQRIKAVRDGRVHKIPDAGFWWYPPGLESPLYFKWLAQKIHPGLFDDYDMIRELKDFYKTFYQFDLSPDTAAGILAGQNQKVAP